MNMIRRKEIEALRVEATENANIAAACRIAGEDTEQNQRDLNYWEGYKKALDDVMEKPR